MSLNIEVKFDKDNNQLVVIPDGDLDIYTSNKFKEKVMNNFDRNQGDIFIKGSKLQYIDSTGLGALISILKKVKETKNEIFISDLKPNIRKLFDITELDKLFTIRGEGDE
ncbi:MAG: STAS domain-containing protein [Tissierella sp.]|nr:STAS domain-containing protein [Tissierella sp.]